MMHLIEQQRESGQDGEVGRVRGVRRKLSHVRQILLEPSPELLGDCGPVLEEAAELLGSLVEGRSAPSLAGAPYLAGGADLMHELQMLRRELAVVTALMQQAAGYYLGWAQMLGAATGGYTSHGDALPLKGAPSLSLVG